MCALDFHLFSDLETAILRNVVATSSLPIDSVDRYAMGTPNELSSALRRTWEYCPTSERIVEDVSRLPWVIDQIIAHEGGLVPDFECEHKGCSKRKRKAPASGPQSHSVGASRAYHPPPEVAEAMKLKREELRLKAEDMLM